MESTTARQEAQYRKQELEEGLGQTTPQDTAGAASKVAVENKRDRMESRNSHAFKQNSRRLTGWRSSRTLAVMPEIACEIVPGRIGQGGFCVQIIDAIETGYGRALTWQRIARNHESICYARHGLRNQGNNREMHWFNEITQEIPKVAGIRAHPRAVT
ncbi:hypothetical protein B0H10DRAFT_1944509 [Mycena sp. CBHHK59/15]|nr:hypothetical protein B0H10DRAFT_1944509 [Mycena sp. CBHHK59/15]